MRDLMDLGVRRKGALWPAPHYRSCQPPSTDMRGPAVAWGYYLELVSAAWRWLILYSYHSASWEPQLLFLVIMQTLLLLHCNFSPIKVLLGRAWAQCWGLVAAEAGAQTNPRAAASGGLLCLCSVWRCSHRLWNAVLGVLDEGPPKR